MAMICCEQGLTWQGVEVADILLFGIAVVVGVLAFAVTRYIRGMIQRKKDED